ncbi:MarR family winged helix-turn-helix transcriptional regulator [Actinoplanes subtropicus]|uniref:MarR family winged helix-turn-helix transcriptional regulator n=1 Tax=Actinoplanes subtropicus TaxID=543632 RepID=UPI0004C442F0|nr:MarR family transcriptional regulator [Actinoplanes subtropicus]
MTDKTDSHLDLVFQLRRIASRFDQLGGAYATSNSIHPTDLRALTLLIDAGRQGLHATPGWLSQKLPMNSAGVTSLLKRLERNGYIKRLPDADDKRRVRILVDIRAEGLGHGFTDPLVDKVAAAVDGFSERDLKVVQRFLNAVEESVQPKRPTTASEG